MDGRKGGRGGAGTGGGVWGGGQGGEKVLDLLERGLLRLIVHSAVFQPPTPRPSRSPPKKVHSGLVACRVGGWVWWRSSVSGGREGREGGRVKRGGVGGGTDTRGNMSLIK